MLLLDIKTEFLVNQKKYDENEKIYEEDFKKFEQKLENDPELNGNQFLKDRIGIMKK